MSAPSHRVGDRRTISSGAVRLDPLFQAPDPALVSGGNVTFEPRVLPHRLGIRIHSNGVVAGACPKLLPAKAGPVCGAISEGESRSYSKHQL